MRLRTETPKKFINDEDHRMALIANALGHPLRIALVRYLSNKNNGKGVDNATCNKDLVQLFEYSQSTISQHVKVLKEAGIFITESKDKFTFYTLNRDVLNLFVKSILK